MRKRKEFSREFKKEAVMLLEEGKKPGADLARELGEGVRSTFDSCITFSFKDVPIKNTPL